MKKVFMGMFAIATMLLATSCSEDELIAQSSGNEVTVSFTANVRSDVKTKAVGDDTEGIDQLIFAVYDENGVELQALRQSTHPTEDGCTNTTAISLSDADGGKKKATINVVLVKGQTYSFAFWAQNAAYDVYSFNSETAEVSIDYTKQANTANKREADAFFANETLTVSGSFEKDITLKRPFAQVNFLTTIEDIKNARAAGFDPKTSSIVVENAATSLNVLTGEVDGNEKAVFNYANLLYKKDKPNEIEAISSITGLTGVYKYLATAYFLPTEATAETQITTSMEVKAEESTKGVVALTAPDVKARRNYRTNIYGNLLTSNGQFNVTIDPIFDGDYSVEVEEETVSGISELQSALNKDENKAKTEALTYNVESTDALSNVEIIVPDDTQAASLTFNLENLATDADITIKDEDDSDADSYDKPVVIEVPEGVNLDNITIDLPKAHVTLKQGSYSTVISSTSSTTLEVGAGTKIETLTVNQGNVRIAEGGEVGTITNSTEGTLYVLMAGGEWTKITEKDAKTIVIYEDTKHAVALNDKYSADNMSDLMSYNKDVLNATELYFELNSDATISIGAQQPSHYLGTDITEVITINGNKNKLTFNHVNSDWNYIRCTNENAKVFIENVHITNNGHNDGPWNRHDIRFYNAVELTNVTSDKAIALLNNGTLTNVTISDEHPKNSEAYGLWITAEGQTVTLNNCNITAHSSKKADRGIKIANEYVDSPQLVTLKVTNTKFSTQKKAAILVTSEAGANITLDNVDISDVLADTKNEVWVDEDYKDYFDKVSVTGGYLAIEGVDGFAVKDGVAYLSNDKGWSYAANYSTINLADGEYDVYDCGGKTLTINGSKDAVIMLYNDGEDGCDYAFGANGTGVGNITFNGITINTTKNTGNYKGFAYMKGTFNDCNFVGAYSLNNANDFVFNNCTFDFKNGYFWTWGANSVKFDGCTFNGNSKNILAHGYASTKITINNCNFAATEKGFTGSGDNTACVEIDPAGTNTYTINFTGNNTKTEYYAGWTRIKDGSTGHTITGVQ